MRILPILVLALAGSAPAQPPVADWVEVTIPPFPELARPLQGPVGTEFVTSVSCLLATSRGDIPILYSVVESPTWATVLVSPLNEARSAQDCENGRVEFRAHLLVTATADAPGFAPAPIRIEARVEGGKGAERGVGEVPVAAGYFSILEVQVHESIAVVAPGGVHGFTFTVANLGNAATRVEARLTEVAEGLQASPPAPFILGSLQHGAKDHRQDVTLLVRADDADGFVNRVGVVNLALSSAYAMDDSFPGESGTASFLLTVRTGGDEGGAIRSLPLAWLLAPAGLALAALLRRL